MAKRKKTTLGVVHVTASSPKSKLTPASLKAIHLAAGFSDTGYNEWIGRDGKLYSGRAGGIDTVGAHVAGFNSIAYGIALEGGINAAGKGDISTITDAQWATLEKRMKEVTAIYLKKDSSFGWCGHRDLSPDKNGNGIIEPSEYLKECPCFDTIPWAESKGLPTANIKGTWKSTTVPDIQGPIYEGPDTRTAYLQRLLTKAGFIVVDDGIVGPKTTAAIKGFQQVYLLPLSGKFDTATVKALRDAIEYKGEKPDQTISSENTPSGPNDGSGAEEEKDKQTIQIPVEVKEGEPTKVDPVIVTQPKEEGVSGSGWAAIVALITAIGTAIFQYGGN